MVSRTRSTSSSSSSSSSSRVCSPCTAVALVQCLRHHAAVVFWLRAALVLQDSQLLSLIRIGGPPHWVAPSCCRCICSTSPHLLPRSSMCLANCMQHM
jgi:hypothetical protein